VAASTVDMHPNQPTIAIHYAQTQDKPQTEQFNCGVYCNIV